MFLVIAYTAKSQFSKHASQENILSSFPLLSSTFVKFIAAEYVIRFRKTLRKYK